jgi:diguanylate cyclase (GGDEF)-like protein/PAS domain S-box-containing protein
MSVSQLFETLTLAVPGLVWVSDAQGHVEFNNAQWSEFTGLPQEKGLGLGWLDSIHPADAAAFRAQLPMHPDAFENVQAEMRVRRYDGVYHRHLLNVRHVGDGKWVGCAIDAHEWLTAKLRDAIQGNILEMVIGGVALPHLLAELCKAAERQIPGATCSILLVDAVGSRFIAGFAPNLPDELMAAVPNLKIGTGVGSCGTAAFEKRDVISTDIASDPLWDSWRQLVLPLGFQACWSKPVFAADGDVIASFGFYFRDKRGPSPAELQELTRLRGLASLAIERVRMFEALRESEEHYRYTVEQNPQIPWTADPRGQILSVSSRWAEMTGISQTDALGNGWLQALHPDDVAPTVEKWAEGQASGEPVDFTYRIRLSTGQYRWARARATARRNELGTIIKWYGTVEDIHEHHLAAEKLRRQVYEDELTGLPNRRRFVEELRRRLASTHDPIGLMVLDMDDFKLVNDRYGHLTGDSVLRLFARYLQRIVEPNEFVARLSGDEFAIICRNISDDVCLVERAQSIEAKLEASLKRNKKTRSLRPSIGCALGQRGEHPDEVFQRADLALYAAKSAGKGTVQLFNPAIRNAAQKRSRALELARTALREDWIEPYYQPILSLNHHGLRGFEALLRINHPEDGLLSPLAIKDALEDPRLADGIGVRMAHLVIENMGLCIAAGIAFGQVSINLATENLVNAGFMTNVLGLLDQKDLPHSAIKLEITERVLMDEVGESVVENLARLRQSGVGISLDDFGTGYASLVHLQALPVDEIKIDRSFVSGLGTDKNKGEIVRAMLGLAKALNITTVAEGIEEDTEARVLREWGCDYGQGYLFGKPMSFEAASEYALKRATNIVVDNSYRRSGR